MQQLIAGNWKMHGRLAEVAGFAAALRAVEPDAELLVCPPFTLLDRFAQALAGSRVALGAQDCHPNAPGPHTGDIAAAMLAEAGASHVILGHSERRADHGETNAEIHAKARAAAEAGLIPIVCVGETEAQRDAGEAEDVVRSQIEHSLPADFSGTVAYEPVWAIGTGKTPTERDVAAMHTAIRAALLQKLGEPGRGLRILYGGSVKPGNARALLALPEVGGALIGGASLKAEDFLAIAACAVGV